MFKMMSALVAAALFVSGSATAQTRLAAVEQNTAAVAPAPQLGAPVTCEAKGYFSGGTVKFVIRRLDESTGAADADYVDFTGVAVSKVKLEARNASFSFKDGVLEYNRPNAVKWHLVVGAKELKGSYRNYNATGMSKPDITMTCDGPLERVIVKK